MRCKKDDPEDVGSAAEKIVLLLQDSVHKQLSEARAADPEAQQRFTEIKEVLEGLAEDKEEYPNE